MKKLAAIFLCASCAFLTGLNAQQTKATEAASATAESKDVAALQKRVEELEKLLADAEKAMYELLAKDMKVISKLRAENRALKDKVELLSAHAASVAPQQQRVQKNTISEWKTPQQQYDEIRAEGAKVRKDADAISAEYDEIKKKAEAAEKARKSENSEKDGSSFWDHAFPF